MFKSIVLHERRRDFTRAQFMDHWINVHTPMSQGAQHLHGYVCHEVLTDVTPDFATPLLLEAAVDGIAEMWFDKADGLLTLPEQPSVKRWFSDGPNFIGRRMRFMAEESVLREARRGHRQNYKLIVFFGRSADEVGDSTPDMVKTIKELARTIPRTRGVFLSDIVSHHPTDSIGDFPMDRVDCVLEIIVDSKSDAEKAIDEFVQALHSVDPRCNSIRVRAFGASEFVVRTPASQGNQ
jgi:hypothetical protein